MQRNKISILAVLLLFLAAMPMLAKEKAPVVTEVAANLYMISGLNYGGNVAFLVTDGGVLVVDSGGLPSDGKTIVELVKQRTETPIKYLVLTHYHGDHTNGIDGFPGLLTIIGHKNIVTNIEKLNRERFKKNVEENFPNLAKKSRARLEELKDKNDPASLKEKDELLARLDYIEQSKTITFKTPNRVFDKKKTIELGGQTIELIYPGPAHTDCNCLVYFPGLKVIHMGDILFQASYPYIDFNAGCNTQNWCEVLKNTAAMDIEKVIPGHGELTGKDGLLQLSRYLADLRKAVKAAVAKGLSVDEMKKSITFPAYKDFARSSLLASNIEAVYNELTAAAK
jgi:glyoxylase-like metal-dependent hydrolase (beta-lactamase superfamily II)